MAKRLTALFPGYFPSVSWWQRLAAADRVIFLDGQLYSPRAGLNKTWVKTSVGKKRLIVPVLRHGLKGTVADKEIDGTSNWFRTHQASLASNYRNAPYFDTYFPYFRQLYGQKWQGLLDLNLAGIRLILKLLRWPEAFVWSSSLNGTGSREMRVKSALTALDCDTYILDEASKGFFDAQKLSGSGFDVHWMEDRFTPYCQQFDGFSPDLSIIDLLMNEGPYSTVILREFLLIMNT